ncbi:MAG: flagellar biosynthesis anti-sigma factor FlgM [Desulfarculus sp.]|nr:flagellar biosynthesis anti-sigma factor FlgM [Desulfarculus sp.]
MQIKETLGLTNKAVENRDRASSSPRVEDKAATRSGEMAQAASSDRVELSGRSREMAKAAEALANTTDVREQRVAEIKQRIANQEYTVDAEKVAQRMIVDFLRELV